MKWSNSEVTFHQNMQKHVKALSPKWKTIETQMVSGLRWPNQSCPKKAIGTKHPSPSPFEIPSYHRRSQSSPSRFLGIVGSIILGGHGGFIANRVEEVNLMKTWTWFPSCLQLFDVVLTSNKKNCQEQVRKTTLIQLQLQNPKANPKRLQKLIWTHMINRHGDMCLLRWEKPLETCIKPGFGGLDCSI